MHGEMILMVMQAAEALQLDSALAGQAYFITNGVTMPFWDFIGDFLEPMGWGRPRIPLPGMLIFIVAWILQYVIFPMVRAPAVCICITTHDSDPALRIELMAL